jgi:hypothetical protein
MIREKTSYSRAPRSMAASTRVGVQAREPGRTVTVTKGRQKVTWDRKRW